jgi:hypothetical protein
MHLVPGTGVSSRTAREAFIGRDQGVHFAPGWSRAPSVLPLTAAPALAGRCAHRTGAAEQPTCFNSLVPAVRLLLGVASRTWCSAPHPQAGQDGVRSPSERTTTSPVPTAVGDCRQGTLDVPEEKPHLNWRRSERQRWPLTPSTTKMK